MTSSLSFFSQLQASDSGSGTHTADDVAPSAFIYFSASAAVIAMCILGYIALPYLPYGRYKLLLAGIINDPKVGGGPSLGPVAHKRSCSWCRPYARQ